MDAYDDGTEYRLVLELPGVTKNALDVNIGPAPGTITVRADLPEEEKAKVPLHSERMQRFGGLGHFERVIPVAWDADVDKMKPQVQDGILTITIPKRSAAQKSQKS